MFCSRVAKFVALVALSCAPAGTSWGTIIVSENFDGYADTAAMQANWGATGAGTLSVGGGNPGNAASHLGLTVNSWIGSAFSITPTALQNIVLTADIFDDATSANERMTVGLRSGANPLFEMGHYNSTAEQYHVRVLNMYGNESWAPLQAGLYTGAAGWNRYQATFSATGVTVTIDLGADGSIDGTFNSVGAPSANAFTDLRFGGPSNLSSAGGGVLFDNIRLETVAVPEPTSGALLCAGLGGIFALRRRRRSR